MIVQVVEELDAALETVMEKLVGENQEACALASCKDYAINKMVSEIEKRVDDLENRVARALYKLINKIKLLNRMNPTLKQKFQSKIRELISEVGNQVKAVGSGWIKGESSLLQVKARSSVLSHYAALGAPAKKNLGFLNSGILELGECAATGDFVFSRNRLAVMTISKDGGLRSPTGKYTARSQNPRQPSLIDNLSVDFGKWKVGLTDKYHLGFAYGGKVLMYVHQDGDVWNEMAGGYMAPAEPNARMDATEELGMPGNEGINLGRWKIGLTDNNHLVFMHAKSAEHDLRITAGINTKTSLLYNRYIHGYAAVMVNPDEPPPVVSKVEYTRAHMDLNNRFTTLGSVGESTRCIFPFHDGSTWQYTCAQKGQAKVPAPALIARVSQSILSTYHHRMY